MIKNVCLKFPEIFIEDQTCTVRFLKGNFETVYVKKASNTVY